MANEERRSVLVKERLDYFRRMPNREIAVTGALDFCVENNVPVPADLAKEAVTVLCSLLKRERPRRKGRANTALARFRQDMIDTMRWNEVHVMVELQSCMHVSTVDDYKEPEFAAACDRHRKMCAWLGSTQDRAFECAAMSLCDSIAFGGKAAVKASYVRVEKALRSPTRGMQYSFLDSSTLPKLGLEDVAGMQGINKQPIYERTL